LPEQLRRSEMDCIFQNNSPLIIFSLYAVSESNKNPSKPRLRETLNKVACGEPAQQRDTATLKVKGLVPFG
jgi:hypothetical protein